MVKSLVDYQAEIDRMNEWLFNNLGSSIKDKDSYGLAFRIEMLDKGKNEGLSNFEKMLLDKSFKEYRDDHPNVSERSLFTEAGGKDLSKDREQTRNVTDSRKEFERKGAQRSDLRGLDTKVPARVKRKVVMAQREFVTVKGKRQVRFRDSKGRFASRKT